MYYTNDKKLNKTVKNLNSMINNLTKQQIKNNEKIIKQLRG